MCWKNWNDESVLFIESEHVLRARFLETKKRKNHVTKVFMITNFVYIFSKYVINSNNFQVYFKKNFESIFPIIAHLTLWRT